MKKLFKILLISLFLSLIALFFNSCNIAKSATKDKNDIQTFESVKTQTIRKGDTVTYYIPSIKYKDTVIKTVSEQGTVIRNYYNKEGQIYKNDCISSEINELREEIKQTNNQSKNKQSQKVEKFDSSFILYIIGGIVILGIIGFILIFLLIRNNTKAIRKINLF